MIRLDLKDTIITNSLHTPTRVCSTTLSEFKCINVELEDLVKKLKTKSCATVPVITTSILKLCIEMLCKYITTIVNNSLMQVTFKQLSLNYLMT